MVLVGDSVKHVFHEADALAGAGDDEDCGFEIGAFGGIFVKAGTEGGEDLVVGDGGVDGEVVVGLGEIHAF